MQKSKKIAIIVSIAVAALLCIGLLIAFILNATQIESPPTQNVSNTEPTFNENLLDMINGTSSTTTENLPQEAANENQLPQQPLNNADNQQFGENNATGNPHEFSDERILANIDQNRAKATAISFIKGFLTYNEQILKTNAYKPAWVEYVFINEQSGPLIKQRMNDAWTANTSTYSGIYSAVTDVQVDDIYVSHNTHDNAVSISLTCIIDENQGDPGDMDWAIVNTDRVHYAVYMNSDLKVVDVRRQDAKTLNSNIFGASSNGVRQ